MARQVRSIARIPMSPLYELMEERVGPRQQEQFKTLKSKHIQYLSKVNSLPPSKVPINWGFYETKVPNTFNENLKDFKQRYLALEVPLPNADKLFEEIREQTSLVLREIEIYIKRSKSLVVKLEDEKKFWEEMPPYDEMTMEDFYDYFPENALKPLERPTFWPHNEEEQLDEYSYISERLNDEDDDLDDLEEVLDNEKEEKNPDEKNKKSDEKKDKKK